MARWRPSYPGKPKCSSPPKIAAPIAAGALGLLGEDVSETLEYVPARFKVVRTVRPKLSCTRCDCIVQQPAPHRPIDRGLAGPGLLAHVMVSKYADHLPLYRQSEIYARVGVELERATLAGWVGGTARTLEPLVDALKHYVLDADKLHGEDIPVPVLAPGNGKTRTGRLWAYVRDDRPAGSAEAPVPPGLPTRRTAKVSIQGTISRTSTERCRPMALPVSTGSIKPEPSSKRPLGACPAQVPRPVSSAPVPDRRRSPETDRRTLRDRKRDSRPATR